VLVENVRFLVGYRRPGLVDEASLEHPSRGRSTETAPCRSALSFRRGRRSDERREELAHYDDHIAQLLTPGSSPGQTHRRCR
jgi:hypothetical protein